jgi:hypothetical protein
MRLSSNQSSGQVTVDPVPLQPKRLRKFYMVPFQIYDKTPQWTAPFYSEFREFFSKKNPLWNHAEVCLFIARRDGVTVGRIAAFIDHLYCKSIGAQIGFFGFFECTEDYACAEQLFRAAEGWLASKDMSIVRGPVDGRVDVGCGFLVSGFDSPQTLLATYSPPYYARFAEQHGMTKVKDLLTFCLDLTKPLSERLEDKARSCLALGITIRPFNRLQTGTELRWWVDLFLETFHDHWGFVPVSGDEVRQRFGVRQLRWFVDTRLFLVAESAGTPVAFLWATPDYNQVFRLMHGRLGIRGMLMFLAKRKDYTTGKLHFIGIHDAFKDKAIASCLNHAVFVEMQRRGYRSAEIGWIDEENMAARRTMAVTGASVVKVHRVFEKTLTEESHA